MSAHTAGPWRIGPLTESSDGKALDGAEHVAIWGGNIKPGNHGACVCSISPRDKYNATDEANARLIAAAPDLLDAMREYLAERKALGLTADSPAVRGMRAAIARAEGKS